MKKVLSYAWYGAIHVSVNQNLNALTTGAIWGGDIMVACSATINGRVFGVSTWKQMLVEAEGRTSRIQDGGPLWGHAGFC